jgi:hypothetical protein
MCRRLPPVMPLCFALAAVPPLPAADPAELKFADPAQSQAEYKKAVAPFLARHCTGCHAGAKAKGDLDLTALDPDMKASTSGARWAMVVEKIASGEMPPKDKPRPADEELVPVGRWAHAEARRAGKPFTRRAAYANGNAVPHELLFDPKRVPPYDGGPRVRRLSPEIYAAFTNDLAKNKPGIGQPFSPEGKTTFKDMGAPKVDEPVVVQLLNNAVLIAEAQTAHKLEDGKVKAVGQGVPKEFLALLDPDRPPTDAELDAAVARQFEIVLRRPPTADEKGRFAKLMKRNVADAGRVVGVRYTLAAVMLLPEVVFRLEVGAGRPDDKGRVRLSAREIAYALAYALTDRRPDGDLLKAVAGGELDTDAGVARQARRLLDDPKADKARVLRFFQEYFDYPKAADVFKDNVKEFGYDARVLVADTDHLIQHVLRQDKDVLKELLTTRKGFVNTRVDPKKPDEVKEYHSKNNRKTHLNYSLPADWQWTPDQPITFPGGQRAGVLSQPSWLIAHSTSFDNHVIHRGKWVRERLLGGVVPDIPITVDAQLPDAPHHTLRQRMAVTQEKYCWQCHRLMNDVGYPFERFDHLGRYRTAEPVLDAEATKKNVDKKGKPLGPVLTDAPLDTAGLVAFAGDEQLDGPVSGPAELMAKLASSERVEQVFVRHAFRYWMGRNESPGDAATLQAAHKAYKEGGGSMNSLVVALLSGESFLYRVPDPKK